jgi:hypothetical protein
MAKMEETRGQYNKKAHGAQTRRPNKQRNSLVSVWAISRSFIVLRAVVVGAIIEVAIPFLHWPSSSLIIKMPLETCEGSMVCAFMLQEQGALLHSEFFQIPAEDGRINYGKFSCIN